MTQEDKELLLKDLSARLPYGVILNIDYYDLQGDGKLKNRDVILSYSNIGYCSDNTNWVSVKPYLRPMSSMTEEEYNELRKLLDVNTCRHSSCGEPHKTTFGIDVIAIESYNPNLTKYVPILINMIPIDWLN